MNAIQNTFRLTAMAAALVAVFGPAWADETEVNELIKPDSSISIGIGNWTNDRHQLGIYGGMREKGTHGLIDADINKRDDATGTWYKFKATNLGLEDREIRGEYLQQGNFGITVDYNKLTRENPYTFTTRLRGIGTTTQVVSNNANLAPFQTVNLGTSREGVGLALYKNLFPGLDFNLSFKNEEKTGTRQWGRGSAAEFAVEPINSVIRQVEGTLSYSTKSLQLSGGYYGSWYDTNNELVTIFTGTIGNSATYLSQPLDNQAHQFFLNGGYNFTPTTRATLKMSYTHATQDEHLPTKDITGLSLASSPSSLNGEVNTTLIQLGLTSRPIKDLSLTANLRYYDVKDETPVARFVQTNAACGASQCVDNTPFSYRTVTGKLEGNYRIGEGYSLTAGVEERSQERTVPVSNAAGAGGTDTQRVVPMRSTVDETTWRLELRKSLSDMLNGSMAYIYSQRTGSVYSSAGSGAGGSASDFINPINIADRDRNKVRLALDWTPIERLTFQFNVEEGRDSYDHGNNRRFGLTEGTNHLYSFDATFTLSDKWQINTWYSYDYSQAKQLNSRTLASNSLKDNDLEDTGNTLGLGMRGEASSRIKLGADIQWARNVSKYKQTLNAAQTAAFNGNLPNIENKMTRFSIFSTYALEKNSDLRLDLIHERWKTDDWSWTYANGAPFAYPNANANATVDGTTVTANPKQSSSFVGIRYIYKFQ